MKLRAWQAEELLHTEPKRLVRADPRLGKTEVGLRWLADVGAIGSLVVAPLVVCPQWAGLLQAQGRSEVIDLYSKSSKRVSLVLDTLKRRETPFTLVVNYDKLKSIIERLIKLGLGALILDESHYIKSPSSSRGRAARRLAHSVPAVRLLTGTVAPNGPGDLWGQFSCVDKELWGSSYTAFAKRHLILDAFMYDRVVGVRDPKKLQTMVDQCSGSYRREDVFGPDQWQTVVRSFDLEPKARKLYDTAVKDWVLEQERDGLELTMTHTLSRMLRLRQLACGYLPNGEGGDTIIHTNKIDLVLGDLEDVVAAGEKVVLFHQFTWEGDQYQRRAGLLGCPVFRVSGQTDAHHRAQAIGEFAELSGSAIFLAQTAAGGVGISLATATHCFFTSQSYSFDVEHQARDRVFSPGKSRCVSYYRANRSIDNYIATILESKSDFNTALSRSSINDICFGELDLPTYKGF